MEGRSYAVGERALRLAHRRFIGLHRRWTDSAVFRVLAIAALMVWMRPPTDATNVVAPSADSTGSSAQFGYESVQPILAQRCYACHSEAVQMKNVRLDSAQAVAQHAQSLYTQAVVARTMPLNNATGMTDDERQMLKIWFEAGASVR